MSLAEVFTSSIFFLSIFLLVISIPKTFNQQRYITGSLGWLLFGMFWLGRFPYYVFKTRSFIYLLLIPLLSLGCFIIAKYIYSTKTHTDKYIETYQKVTKATAIASGIYMPFSLFNPLRKLSIETVASQTYESILALGINNVTLTTGPEFGYQSEIVFHEASHQFATHIAPNCTGIGSMAVILAVIWITNQTLLQKIAMGTVAIGIIHLLNLARNVFIAVGFGHQWFSFLNQPIAPLLGYTDPRLVSFFVADKVLAQLGSAIVLLFGFYLFIRIFPEIRTLVEETYQLLYNEVKHYI